MTRWILPLALALALPAAASAQQKAELTGTWEAKTKDGPKTVIIRPDSSASYGKEIVRWRWPRPDRILLALGGEWVEYKMKLSGAKLTLSEGDLTEPITLTRVGPPSARPAAMQVPPDPDTLD